jgi:flavin reductase (DIM6/NTAB) family NADH-FMN oxidoreductase RutF
MELIAASGNCGSFYDLTLRDPSHHELRPFANVSATNLQPAHWLGCSPIALITSLNLEGRVNAAPFSVYNYLGTDPAIVAIGIGNRLAPDVIGKDTAQNIRHVREIVINVVNEELAAATNIPTLFLIGEPWRNN